MKRKIAGAIVAVAVLFVAGVFAWQRYHGNDKLFASTVETSSTSKSSYTSAPADATLSQSLTSIFNQYPQVTVGVSVINLNTNSQTNYGSSSAMTAASTTKLVTALDFMHEVEAGKYTLSSAVGPETAQWQLQQLINQSNNDSWQEFINLLGGSQIQQYAQSIGLSSFNFENNTITPADDADMLAQLYQGKLLNSADTQLILSYMQNTNDELLIPAALPQGAVVYHKYGELLETTGNYVHDTAIIIYEGHSFVLSIYTDNPQQLDITDRIALIHAITTAVVNYETQK